MSNVHEISSIKETIFECCYSVLYRVKVCVVSCKSFACCCSVLRREKARRQLQENSFRFRNEGVETGVGMLCCSQSSPPIAGLRMCSSQCMHHIVQRRRSTLALNHLQAPPLLFFQQTWAYCFLFGRDAISAAAAAGPASPCFW